MDDETKRLIQRTAWDATVGAGNFSERVSYAPLKRALGREPTYQECRCFREAWLRCVQEMMQP